jgi:probable F420-dependent oxidoreductase
VAVEGIEALDTGDQALARVRVEVTSQHPDGLGEITGGQRGVEALSEAAEGEEMFVLCGDRLFNPGHQRAGWQIPITMAIEPVGDHAILFGSRQAAQAGFRERLAGDRAGLRTERCLAGKVSPQAHVREYNGHRTGRGIGAAEHREGSRLQIGVVFPQTEIGPDPAIVRAYAEAAEGAGFGHLMVYDHVIGASTRNRPDWRGPYTDKDQFHEPFVLFGYLAAITTRLELVVGVIILPQRQTVLVAKQAAEVDRLSGGRLRLGVGVGWNEIEYIALNERFANRGRRFEEQIEVMRALWTQEVVDFTGRYHTIPEAGIKPMPVQQPIPLWIGGTADVVMERVGRLADGWFPQRQPGAEVERWLDIIAKSAHAAGRDPSAIGMEGRITLQPGDENGWRRQTEAWRAAGASHLAINTMGAGRTPEAHIETILRYSELLKRG